MNFTRKMWRAVVPVAMATGVWCMPAAAQGPVPIIVPIVVDTAAPIVVNVVKPKTTNGLAKFEGTVLNATIAQITVRAKGNDLSIKSFPLSEGVSAKMQRIVDKGGYQFGDKVTVFYDPNTSKAIKIKGKPSRPI
jgi:hypothetical protein